MGHKAHRLTPVIYYEYSTKSHALKPVYTHSQHPKWFIVALSVAGLSCAWWLSQSNTSYHAPPPTYQMLDSDSGEGSSPVARQFTTLSDVFFQRTQAEIHVWLTQAEHSTPQLEVLAFTLPTKLLFSSEQSAQAHLPQALIIAPQTTAPLATSDAQALPITGEALADDTNALEERDGWKVLVVQQGDTLSSLFNRYAINRDDLYRLLALKNYKQDLTRLYPYEEILIKISEQGDLLALKLDLNREQELLVEVAPGKSAEDKQFAVQEITHELEKTLVARAGLIESSLFADGKNAGISGRKILEMTHIFNWDIDFSQNLQDGDSFSLVYEEFYHEGERVKEGPILAAEFVNQGHYYQALRYTNPSGNTAYYTPDGHSLQRAFIRNPVKVGQITSKFSLSRYHPLLHKFRAHKGVDYGAPVGTPVYAVGEGKVVFAGQKNGYGNVIILQHWDTYSSLYAHLSAFAKGLKVGQTARQEQAIGYVGQTGLATAPHLHYEFRINDEHQDPLTVKLPQTIPIDPHYKQDFLKKAKVLMAKLKESNGQIALQQAH